MSTPVDETQVYYFTIPSWVSFDSRQALDWRNLKIDKGSLKSVVSESIVYLQAEISISKSFHR